MSPAVFGVTEGTLVTSTATFRDDADALADPPDVEVSWRKPDATIATYVYGVDAEVVRDSLGIFHMDNLADQAGTWYVKWEGVGMVVTSESFCVNEALF